MQGELPEYRVAARVYFSQWNSLFQNTISNTLSQPAFSHNIYIVTQYFLQTCQESSQVEEAATRLQMVTNKDFIRIVQRVLKRFPLFPLPEFALRLLLGELSTVVLDSQRLPPQRLLEAKFVFSYPELEQAIFHLLHE